MDVTMVHSHEKLLQGMDWVSRHDVWDRMMKIMYFRPLMSRLAKRFSPSDLLHGVATGKVHTKKKIIKLHDMRRVPIAEDVPLAAVVPIAAVVAQPAAQEQPELAPHDSSNESLSIDPSQTTLDSFGFISGK